MLEYRSLRAHVFDIRRTCAMFWNCWSPTVYDHATVRWEKDSKVWDFRWLKLGSRCFGPIWPASLYEILFVRRADVTGYLRKFQAWTADVRQLLPAGSWAHAVSWSRTICTVASTSPVHGGVIWTLKNARKRICVVAGIKVAYFKIISVVVAQRCRFVRDFFGAAKPLRDSSYAWSGVSGHVHVFEERI